MMTKRTLGALALAACLSGFGPLAASAQNYPSGPIKLVLPYAPGGVVDTVGRILAQKLSEVLGETVVPDNKPGAGGILGTNFVAKSAPDGATLLLMDPAIVINPSLQASVPYDLFKELKPVSMVSSSPLVLVVTLSLPVKSFGELVAYGKAHPGELNYASAGIGTTPHLAGELWSMRTGIPATHVPYRGSGASAVDLVAGKVQMAFNSIPVTLPFTQSNQLRALATTARTRPKAYPDIPTVSEAGLSDFNVDLWLALFVPAQTPAAIVAKLNAAVQQSVNDPKTSSTMSTVGVEPHATSAEEAERFIHTDFDLWHKVVEDAHLKP